PPSGGTKDVTPPKLLKTTPENESINFKENNIELSFDEFVVLKDINKQLLISPPFNKKPNIVVHGKKIQIKLKDTLTENTTYIFNFGNAITDFNEGNIFKNFSYAFSTGSYIDSMQIAGQVVNAFSLKPENKESVVLLYNYFNDSVPRKVLPRYVTRTDKSGFFRFSYLKPQNYYIVALNEINDNYLFDLPTEKIGFLDSIITPACKIVQDTVSDSLIVTRTLFLPDSLTLLLFAEKQKTQYITDYKRLTPSHCQIIFFAPNTILPEIHSLETDSFEIETSEKNDTLQIWLPNDTNLISKDTVSFVFSYDFISDSGNVSAKDTLYFKLKKTPKPNPLSFSAANKFPMPENQKVIINFSEPVAQFDTSKIKFVVTSESSVDTIPFLTKKVDSIGRKYLIENNWQFGKSYKISFDTSAIFSVYNHCNDSTGLNISIQDPDYYGMIRCKIITAEKNIVFQLLDANDVLLRETNAFPNDSILVFKQLNPGTYRLKVFIDRNNNGEWDTGNLEKMKQPETVSFYPKTMEVKSGWEMEYDWKIK
ncbi:MAG: Ig-like domain-containing protein, partial [Bacteroidales bacterium]|nr:Ig-like domain-containing protein [Bacteroidales bacterium]